MSKSEISYLTNINSFESLVDYLKEKLYWPIEAEQAEDITFDYAPEDLGIKELYVPKIKSIKQIRPLTDNQPWGLFYIDFETKKLPVVVLRRLLRALIFSSRKRDDRMKSWDLQDLIFISSLGEAENRQVSFAHFSEMPNGLPELRTFSWDALDTNLHYAQSRIDLEKLRWPDDESNADAWREQWTSAFRLRHREVIRTSEQLATAMAQLAIQIRDRIKDVFEYEIKNGPLHKLFDNFERVLIHDLTIDSFADMYAQTIAYGLFSARASHERDFEVEDITAMIPNTNPFLKNLFEECTRLGNSVSENLDFVELGVSELIILLKESNIEAVLQDFGRQKKSEDPVIHFYEDFLREYDSRQKVERGVFYTPDPVVSFIVRSVDYILRTEFDCTDGLADTSTTNIKYKRKSKKSKKLIEDVKDVPTVQVLDPATGTGTFLKYVIKEIKSTFDEKHKGLSEDELKEEWNKYVPKHLLSRIFGFELMAAPYAVAHLKLGLELAETGYDFKSDKRLGVYLTNTLEGTHEGAGTLDAFLNWLAEEGRRADEIKANSQISVVIGNPPYSNYGMLNKSKWILKLIQDYKIGLNEKKINIDDDFIKFIRFGQWRIDKTGYGVLAFITNHTFIDGLTHRKMRESLMKSFNKIYIIDLHGNIMKKETAPDGSVDKNVFDIQQGVSIGIFIKTSSKSKSQIYHMDLWGNREEKYKLLSELSIANIPKKMLKRLNPKEPHFFFVPKDFNLEDEYNTYLPINKIFAERSYGIQTKKDSLFIYFNISELMKILPDILNNSYDPKYIGERFNISSSSGWSVEKLRDLNFNTKYIKSIEYRPLDCRKIYYDPKALGRSRLKTISHMLNENLGLICMRQVFQNYEEYSHFGITENLIDERTFYSNRGGTYLFPLYLYQDGKRNLNFTQDFIKNLEKRTGFSLINKNGNLLNTIVPENVFYYIYGIFHSRNYRKRYSEFLNIEFPRIPLTEDKKLFAELNMFGNDLMNIHLMKSDILHDFITTFVGKGTNKVESTGKNSFKDGRQYINKYQYFDGIPEKVYNFNMGGYQVCQKWLKDRKGRILTEEEIEHYQKIVVAISETIRIMKEIDEVIEEHGGWPIK